MIPSNPLDALIDLPGIRHLPYAVVLRGTRPTRLSDLGWQHKLDNWQKAQTGPATANSLKSNQYVIKTEHAVTHTSCPNR